MSLRLLSQVQNGLKSALLSPQTPLSGRKEGGSEALGTGHVVMDRGHVPVVQ